MNEASPLLQMKAANSGKLLRGSEADFFNFRLAAWIRYQHTAWLRKMRREHLQATHG